MYQILNPKFRDDTGGQFQEWSSSAAWEPAYLGPNSNEGAFVTTVGSSDPYGTWNIFQYYSFSETTDTHYIQVKVQGFVASAGGASLDVYFGNTYVGEITGDGTWIFSGVASGSYPQGTKLEIVATNDVTATVTEVIMGDFCITAEPEEWCPAYNPIQYTISSANNIMCNYKYIADIYVDGSYVTRLELRPDLTGTATFELNRVLQTYVSFDLNADKLGFNDASATYTNFEVRFGEQYDSSVGCDGAITIYTDLAIGDTRYIWNAALSYTEWESYTSDTYKLKQGQLTPFLTHQPRITSISMGDYAELMYIQDNDSGRKNAYVLQLLTYDETGTLVGEYLVENADNANQDRVVTVGVGYENLQAYVLGKPTSVVSGPVVPFISTVTTYTVQLLDDIGSATSELKTYKIMNCTIEPRRFAFVGLLGALDTYTFTNTVNHSSSISRNEFTKLNTSFTVTERGRTVTDVTATEKYTATSGWMSTSEARWIQELFESYEVYLVESAQYLRYIHTNHQNIGLNTYDSLVLEPGQVEEDEVAGIVGTSFVIVDDNGLSSIVTTGNPLGMSNGLLVPITYPELLFNGDFIQADGGWPTVSGAGATFSLNASNRAVYFNNPSGAELTLLNDTTVLPIDRYYKVVLVVDTIVGSGASFYTQLGTTLSTVMNTTGTYRFNQLCTDNGTVGLKAGTAGGFSFQFFGSMSVSLAPVVNGVNAGYIIPIAPFVSNYTPVIVTNSNYEEKKKRTVKNILYRLDYEMANGKQIQRN